jgi:cellulose synthase/poly-beta-1,6-N-acetylglucosamine synthase-like glycosyltransferase
MPSISPSNPHRHRALTDPLLPALIEASPRYSPPRTPLRSILIHAAVLALWALLLARAFGSGGGSMSGNLWGWSVGVAYIAYDTALLAFVAWQTWALLKPQPLPAATVRSADDTHHGTHTATRISVIVASHNEALVLPATLAALLAQTDPPDQIIVADDGSNDGTAALLEQRYALAAPALGALSAPSASHPGLHWLRLTHGGKARALNAAINATANEVVLTVDGDTLLDVGAIAAVRRAFAREPELVATTGVLTPVCSGTASGRVLQWFQTYEYIRNFLSRYAWMQLQSLLLISGAFAGFRRQALVDVGGFDADCLVEDYELIHRLRHHAARLGLDWRFRVLGDAQARTEAPSRIGAFLSQRRRWFGGFLQTQYWYRAMVGDARLGWLGTLMLPVKAIDTLQPLYGLTAFVLLVFGVATQRLALAGPVAGLIAAKITLDLAFHLWSVRLYRRWVGNGPAARSAAFGPSLLAALLEPFTFQLLRHLGAALGWVSFLSGSRRWGRQERVGARAGSSPSDSPP